jgi:hypothetical protein
MTYDRRFAEEETSQLEEPSKTRAPQQASSVKNKSLTLGWPMGFGRRQPCARVLPSGIYGG